MLTPTFDELRAVGLAAGLDAVGHTSADGFPEVRAVLEQRRAKGLHATMAFTYRNPARSTEPAATLPGARTLIVAARSYHRAEPARPSGPGPYARTARYVWGDDQDRLLAGLGSIANALRNAGHRAVVVSDQNNLVDRAVAHRAGLGWFGKNTNLLLPGVGSWFLLGAVITDAVITEGGLDASAGAFQPQSDPPEVPDGCGSCSRCLPACPTGALVAPGVLDARRCLSWTLQATGVFPIDQRVALGDRIYGCDDCQDVCPPNRVELHRRRPDGAGVPALAGSPERAWVDVLGLLAATDDELLARHGQWYIARREPRYLRRNALVVLGNVGDGADPSTRATLTRALADADPIVRAHAVWSARRLGCDDLVMAARDDPDPDVRAELAREVPRCDRRAPVQRPATIKLTS
ncbi:MAG: tRNA epoxyqueuosine(34) reductase QueG [Acidimicrobiales bacterium]